VTEAAPIADLPPLQRAAVAGGRTVAYREAGRGPALVLLHGIGSAAASWRAQLSSLSDRFHVIAWDAPGYGGSDSLVPREPTPQDYAAVLLELVNSLGLLRFALLGHSWGALIAASFARHHAPRVTSLILANASPGYAAASLDIRRARVDGRIADMHEHGPAGLAAKRAAALLSPNAPAAAVEAVRTVMSQLRPDGYAQAARMLGVANILEDARFITVPTLVIGATNDTVTPEEGNQRIAAAIAGSRYAGLVGPGHASYVEDPAAFNAQLTAFIGHAHE
jgi:pimeloyl-ACP methyl ester carboxylesterase